MASRAVRSSRRAGAGEIIAALTAWQRAAKALSQIA